MRKAAVAQTPDKIYETHKTVTEKERI